jgi:hypothetical protein
MAAASGAALAGLQQQPPAAPPIARGMRKCSGSLYSGNARDPYWPRDLSQLYATRPRRARGGRATKSALPAPLQQCAPDAPRSGVAAVSVDP